MLDNLDRLSIDLRFSGISIRVDGDGVALAPPAAPAPDTAFTWQAWDSLNTLIETCRAEIDTRWREEWNDD